MGLAIGWRSHRLWLAAAVVLGGVVGTAVLLGLRMTVLHPPAALVMREGLVLSPKVPSAEPSSRPMLAPPRSLTATEVIALDPAACEQMLRERAIPFESVKADQAEGVRQPMRLRGAIGGVQFSPTGLASATEMGYDVADCRLLLALDGLAAIARNNQLTVIEFFSIYRPARRGRRAGRHSEGLAIDIGGFHRKAGADPLLVLKTFQPQIGRKPCTEDGDLAPGSPTTGDARFLWSLACSVYAARIFHVVLTPNEGPQHRDHFHFDLTTGADWYHLE